MIALSKASSEWCWAIQDEKDPPAASSISLRQASGVTLAAVEEILRSLRAGA